MKNIFTKALLIASMTLFSVLPVAAQALGTSCENPYIVTKEFNTAISEPGSYWFSATTYDLPLRVRYTPSVPTDEEMKVYIDFSCTPGVYDDPNLYELTDMANGWGFEMPLPFGVRDVMVDGELAYYEVSVDESYRELMTNFGILYNVEAKVNVVLPQAGSVVVIPDTVFRHTVENSHWIELPDTINVGVATTDSMYIMPMGDWQGDSIRIEWLGKEAPISIWIASDLEFQMNNNDHRVVGNFTLSPETGQSIIDLTSDQIYQMLKNSGSGLLFAKMITVEDAPVIFDYKPMSPEMARAIPMEMDKAVGVKANDIEQYYYFDKEWSEQSITFMAAEVDTVVAYFGTTPTFTLDASDNNYLGAYTLYPEGKDAILYLSSKELADMAELCQKEFIFVRFASTKATAITPSLWSAGTCTANSVEIFPEGAITVTGNNKDKIYRIDYSKWSKGDVEMVWKGRVANKFYLSDTCSYNLSASDSHVLLYQSVKANQSLHITKHFLDSVADRVNADGYLYFRFDTRATADVQTVFTPDTTAIVEPDLPAEPTTDCSLSSLPLVQGDQVVLNLDSAFTVYRIDYKAWLKSGATLAWNGAEPLHTFVAETCAFALAPHNRYVLAYIPVPAQGNIVLDAIQLAAMEEYVSEDGFLYIRFLTKEEGVLEVK